MYPLAIKAVTIPLLEQYVRFRFATSHQRVSIRCTAGVRRETQALVAHGYSKPQGRLWSMSGRLGLRYERVQHQEVAEFAWLLPDEAV